MSLSHKKVYALAGLATISVALIGYALIKKNRNKKREIDRSPLDVAFVTTDPFAFSGDSANKDALAMLFDEANNDYSLLALTRPPISAQNDLPNSDMSSTYNQFMHSRFDLNDYISEQDFITLQEIGVIPPQFPLDQIVFTRSHNGVNKFMVGYSSPYTQTTNAQPISQVVRPLWVVSFDTSFDPRFQIPDFIDDADLREQGAKMLYAEGMLSRPNDGCHTSQGQNECNSEKSALLQILLERLRLKQEKQSASSDLMSVFTGPGQKWNAGSSFMNPFKRGPDELAQSRFDEFYNHKFWHMPNLSSTATHFIHHYAISNTPNWVDVNVMTPTVSYANYANQHPIRIGRTIIADNSRTFK